MAVVLLGVPQGQNFVAEAADEATKSVALLTLTATGDGVGAGGETIVNTLDAEFSWKSFVQGSTVDIELQFIDLDGSVLGPVNLMELVASGASSEVTSALFAYAEGNCDPAFGSPVDGVPVLVPGSQRLDVFSFLPSGVVSAGPGWAPLCTLVDVAPPLSLAWEPAGIFVPGLARVSVGSSVAFDYAAWSKLDAFVASSTDESIAIYDSGQIKGLSAGRSTLAFGPPSGVNPAFGVFDVDVFHEVAVSVQGRTQRIRMFNPNNVLPSNTTFSAEYVDSAHNDHNFFVTHTDTTTDVELRHYYNLTLTSGGQTLSQLDGPIELWFEAIDGIDAADSFISRVAEGADAKLEPTLYTDDDGITWIKVLTDHFSPYALTDLLSAEEKAALGNIPTGDLPTQISVAGLGMTLVLALGIMLRLITNKRKFEK